MKKILFAMGMIVSAFLSAGCHAQVPATNHTVTLTITAPAKCTAGACTYLISRVTVTGTSCPAATTGTYTALNASAEISGVSYVDSSAAGLSVCYIAQTDLSGAYSPASNIVGPLVVPANPTAPSIGGTQNTTTATLEQKPIFAPKVDEQITSARLEAHIR